MSSTELIKKLDEAMPRLRSQFGVDEIGLFGSQVRNDAKENSDIDVLVKLNEPSFIKLAALLNYLEMLFGKKVDITTKHKNLSPRFLKQIENEIIYAHG